MHHIVKQLGSADRSAHAAIISSLRSKYSVDDFEKSLALFCVSLIGGVEHPPKEAIREIEKYVEVHKSTLNELKDSGADSVLHAPLHDSSCVPLNWLHEQAGGVECFNSIISGEHAEIVSFFDSYANNSDILYLNTQTQDLATDISKQTVLCTDLPNYSEDVRPQKSLLERNETAVKCSWNDDEEGGTPSGAGEINIPQTEEIKIGGEEDVPLVAAHLEEHAGPSTRSSAELNLQLASASVKSPSKRTVEPVFSSRKRRFFSEQEISSLVEGYKRFGPRWTLILDSYPFSGRSPVDLKDKIRNLKKSGLLTVIEKEIS